MHHRDFHGQHADRVAIRRRGSDLGVANDAGSAGAVDDVEWLAELLFQERRDDACGCVRSATHTPGHDQSHRARRIGLRERRREESGSGRSHRSGREGAACNV